METARVQEIDTKVIVAKIMENLEKVTIIILLVTMVNTQTQAQP